MHMTSYAYALTTLRIMLPCLFRSTVVFKLAELDTAVSSVYSVGFVYGTLS
jgi:hypothetical protein